MSIVNVVMSFFGFVRSVFSEDGQGSYSRCAAGAIVIATIAWITHVVWKTGALPELTGPAAFVTTCAGSHYLINKGADLISAVKGTNTNPTPPTPPTQ